jgi:hypothetical protein
MALVRRAADPLKGHLDPFVTWLIEQQYMASVINIRQGTQSRSTVGWRSAM